MCKTDDISITLQPGVFWGLSGAISLQFTSMFLHIMRSSLMSETSNQESVMVSSDTRWF